MTLLLWHWTSIAYRPQMSRTKPSIHEQFQELHHWASTEPALSQHERSNTLSEEIALNVGQIRPAECTPTSYQTVFCSPHPFSINFIVSFYFVRRLFRLSATVDPFSKAKIYFSFAKCLAKLFWASKPSFGSQNRTNQFFSCCLFMITPAWLNRTNSCIYMMHMILSQDMPLYRLYRVLLA